MNRTMKQSLFFTILLLLLTIGSCKQTKTADSAGHDSLRTKLERNRIDLDVLNKPIDLNMDVSALPLYEVRIYRHALAARKGYWFMESDLNAAFQATDWYQSLVEKVTEEGETLLTELQFTPEEQAFIDRLTQREEELKKNNFTTAEGYRVNICNLVNPFQLETFDDDMQEALGRNGFVIVPQKYLQHFHVYENNDYRDFPSFVTTDMYMQLFHMYFSYLLRDLEEQKLIPMLTDFSRKMHALMKQKAETETDPAVKDLAAYNTAYYAIGHALLTGTATLSSPDSYREAVAQEIAKVKATNDDYSDYLGYTNIEFPYSLFRPRGHYTRTEPLKRYFAAMMWFQTAPACLDVDVEFRRVILQAGMLNEHAEEARLYRAIMEPIEFIIGEPDNVSVRQLAEQIKKGKYDFNRLLTDDDILCKFRKEIKTLADAQNRIRPKEENTCPDKINLMPQRYLADNEILQELVDVLDNNPTKRGCPKGLDVFAAFGCEPAEHILLNELKEGEKWDQYEPRLLAMKTKMKSTDWNRTMYNKWIESLVTLNQRDDRYPYFMQTPQWDKKNLNAALASWAELKHDAILYGEQPMAAECGGGGLPEPYTVGYVEPNVAYWKKVIELLDLTTDVLKRNDMVTEKTRRISESMRENAEFLLRASEKELAGKPLTEEEFRQIAVIGSTFEWLTLDLVKQENEYLQSWDDVKGPDKSVAVVADVYTANASNNSNKSILYEATGYVNDLYVVVEINGYLYLTRGSVFSYHEFNRPINEQRMTDEEWQKKLETMPRYGVPEWMQELMLPGTPPVDNETVLYSSGC